MARHCKHLKIQAIDGTLFHNEQDVLRPNLLLQAEEPEYDAGDTPCTQKPPN